MLKNNKTTTEEKSGYNNFNSSNNNEIDVQMELSYNSAPNLNIGDLSHILQDNLKLFLQLVFVIPLKISLFQEV